MREELYEQYKELHPGELGEINRAYEVNALIEEERAQMRMSKVARVAKWKEILAKEEQRDEQGEAGGAS